MRKFIFLFSLLGLLLPFRSQAVLFVPTGTLVLVSQTSQDGVFDYSVKDGAYPYDELDSWQVTTGSGTYTYTSSEWPAFPSRYRISQSLVSGLNLSVVCTSASGDSSVSVVGTEARVRLAEGDVVTCVFHNEEPNTKRPVVIIPGIMGTEMYSDDEKLWADVPRMFSDAGDEFMSDLGFNSDGTLINPEVGLGHVLGKPSIKFDYSEKLISDLHTLGYVDNQDLFLFPYDWRKELSQTANGPLKTRLDEILTSTGQDKVDVLAHSQGGLVIKKLLLDNPSYQSKIEKLIFVGTPHLGAPKSAKALLYGDSMGVSFAGLGLDPEEIKRIGQNMPAVYELLPSQEYFSHYTGYLGTAKKTSLLGDWSVELYGKSETNASLASSGLNSSLIHTADDFHESTLDNFNFAPTGISAYNIVGCQEPTLTEIFQRAGGKFKLTFNAGDGTVPVKSANNLFGAKTYYALDTDHGTMLTSDGTRQQITHLLEGNEEVTNTSKLSTNSSDCQFSGQVVSVHSPVEIDVYDANGNHTGKDLNGNLEVNIPKSTFETIGEEKFVVLPKDGEFRVHLKGLGVGTFSLFREILDESGVASAQTFLNLPVNADTTGEMVLHGGETSELQLDTDGDDQTDQTVLPNILSSLAQEDLVPPTTTLEILGTQGETDYFRSKVNLSFKAIDSAQVGSEPSGIEAIYWRVNDSQWENSSSSIELFLEGQYKIDFYSVDKAGNAEDLRSRTITIDKTPPEARIVFDVSSKGINVTGTEPVQTVSVMDGVLLQDKAGNVTKLGLKKRTHSTELVNILYNGQDLTDKKATFKFAWEFSKVGTLKHLQQVGTSQNFKLHAEYASKKTVIEQKNAQGESHLTFSGLRLIEMNTNKGRLFWTILP